jgi:RNA polymerase primary sigma factor/RNA polymerase nonessential primary-like sigma factor
VDSASASAASRVALRLDGEPATLQKIADRLGLSRERVRQIESNALRHLRDRDELRKLAN